MAFPLIPFIAGAVIGGLATYLYENEKARKQVRKTTGTVTHTVAKGVGTLKRKVSGATDKTAAVAPKEVPEAIEVSSSTEGE